MYEVHEPYTLHSIIYNSSRWWEFSEIAICTSVSIINDVPCLLFHIPGIHFINNWPIFLFFFFNNSSINKFFFIFFHILCFGVIVIGGGCGGKAPTVTWQLILYRRSFILHPPRVPLLIFFQINLYLLVTLPNIVRINIIF